MRVMIEKLFLVFCMTMLVATIAYAEEESPPSSILSATKNVTLSGTIEIEAGWASDYADATTTNVALSTADIGVDVDLTDWAKGHVLFSWDDGVDVDEGFITLGGTDAMPVYLTAGLLYVPFGVYETNMVSDPLTLEIGETRESAAQIGIDIKGFYGSIYMFNGDVQDDPTSQDDTIETFGANAGYALEKDSLSLDVGVDYISNIMDSNGLYDGLTASQEDFLTTNPNGSYELKDFVAGLGAHLIASFGPVTLITEYIYAMDDPEFDTDDGAGTTSVVKVDAPSALHIECAYTFDVKEKELTLAATYQATDNLGGTLPETRYGAAVGIGLTDNLSLTTEFLHDEDYDAADGGTGESADAVNLLLTMEF